MPTGDDSYLREVMTRRDTLHARRYLVSPFADCFVNQNGLLNHGEKSRLLKCSARGNRDNFYPSNNDISAPREGSSGTAVSLNIYDFRVPANVTLEIYVMNALHFRGTQAREGRHWKILSQGK